MLPNVTPAVNALVREYLTQSRRTRTASRAARAYGN